MRPVKVSTYSDPVKSAFKNLREGVMILNKNGRLLDINPAGVKMFGLQEDDFPFGCAPFEGFKIYDDHYQKISEEQEPVSRILNNETFYEEKYIVVVEKKKKSVFISCTGLAFSGDNGDELSGILFIRDFVNENHHNLKSRVVGSLDNKYRRELDQYQEDLKNERKLLQSVIDTIPVMITIYDSRINSVVLNKAVEHIVGWTNEDIRKKNIMELAYPDPKYRAEVVRYMESLEPGFRDIIMRTKDGRDIETIWANVKIPDGRHVGVGIDVSKRKKMERELIKARQKAEKENLVQYAFIQNISHEVRTPMNSILGFTELLYKTVDGKKEKEFLDAITYNGQQLLRLIDDIIDFSRLDKNELSLSLENVKVGSFMQQLKKLVAGIKSQYRKKFLNTVWEIPADAGELVIHTDVHRLRQIFTNLISNAIKYTNEGVVEIGVEIRESTGELVFYVRDTGIGIKKGDHDKVFHRFHRFHRTRESDFRGTGLGLAITKHLVNLLDGQIWFESKYGKGSVFYFTHPYIESSSEMADTMHKPEEKQYSMPDLKGKAILIAEDDVFSYMMMYHMIADTGAEVLHAENGQEALDMAGENRVDLLFLDIRLPELNGFQVIRKLRLEGSTIPVVAQTANALEEDRKKIRRAGFSYHATKPISQNELFSILNRFFD